MSRPIPRCNTAILAVRRVGPSVVVVHIRIRDKPDLAPSPAPGRLGGARTCGVIASLRYLVDHSGARGKDSTVQTPNSSLSVRPVVALAWVMARSSALFFGCEKPCAVPL
jgi:hypothetical protein